MLDQEERETENRHRSARRAGTLVRKHARYGDLTRLLTFTNGGEGDGWLTRREAVRAFWAWYRADGRGLLGRTGIVALAERGGRRGRWHVHAAIRRGYRLDYRGIIVSWSAHLERLGHHSPTGTHRFHAGDDHGKHSDGFRSARTCARYLAKYIAKAFDADDLLPGEHRYESEGCAVPEPERFRGFRLGEVPELVADTFGVDVAPFYDTDGELSGFWFDST